MKRLAAVLLLVTCSLPARAFDAVFSGSAAVDYRLVSGPNPPFNPSPVGITGLTFEVATKLVAEVGHGASFTVKACGGCHGLEVDQGFGELRVQPFFNLRAGRLNVNFGEFTMRHDPANFVTPSKPLPYAMGDMLMYDRTGYNLGIVPAPWVDNGLEFYGTLPLGPTVQLDYSAWLVKGFAGDNDLDFAASRSWLDNNHTPAFGGRLVLTGDEWAVGASGSAGAYDALDSRWYVMAGLETYFRVGPVTVRAEALGRRTDLDPTAAYAFVVRDTWFLKAGWYAQVDWAINRWVTVAVRSDGLQRWGLPLPESVVGPAAGVQRQTLALLVRVHENFALKGDYELWTFSGAPFDLRHVGRLGVVAAY